MLQRILKAPRQRFFLSGPRGSGKSTWLKSMFPDAHVIDLLSAWCKGLRAIQPLKDLKRRIVVYPQGPPYTNSVNTK